MLALYQGHVRTKAGALFPLLATYSVRSVPAGASLAKLSHCWQRTVYGQAPTGASLAKYFPLLATYSIRSSTYWSLFGEIVPTAGNVQYSVKYPLEPRWRKRATYGLMQKYGRNTGIMSYLRSQSVLAFLSSFCHLPYLAKIISSSSVVVTCVYQPYKGG